MKWIFQTCCEVYLLDNKRLKELLAEPAKKHEQLLVGFMWSNPQLYRQFRSHNIEETTFAEKRSHWFYWLGELMWNNGVRTYSKEAVYSFLDSRKESEPELMSKYNAYGGYETVGYLKKWCTEENKNEEYHLSEVQKYEALRNFVKEGLINRDEKLINKLTKMTLKQVQTYFNHKYKAAFKNINAGELEVVDLIDKTIYDDIEEMDKGMAMGIRFFHAPRLTKLLKGWQMGKLIYLIMPSGVGKSTMTRAIYIMTLIENNEKALVYVNEESKLSWRMSLLSVVATYILKKRVSRDKISEGSYDDYVKKTLIEAADWLMENRPDYLKLVILKKYRFNDIINTLEYHKAHGVSRIILDTFKPDGGETDMARWEVFGKNSQELYDIIKPENLNIGTLATLQLKIGKVNRYLDHDCVGKSKEVVEVADATMLGRLLFKDEYDGKKAEIFAFNYKKDELTNEWYKHKYILEEDKDYLIFYFGKNRMSSASKQLIYEINYDFNELIEVAYAEEKPDAPKGY